MSHRSPAEPKGTTSFTGLSILENEQLAATHISLRPVNMKSNKMENTEEEKHGGDIVQPSKNTSSGALHNIELAMWICKMFRHIESLAMATSKIGWGGRNVSMNRRRRGRSVIFLFREQSSLRAFLSLSSSTHIRCRR